MKVKVTTQAKHHTYTKTIEINDINELELTGNIINLSINGDNSDNPELLEDVLGKVTKITSLHKLQIKSCNFDENSVNSLKIILNMTKLVEINIDGLDELYKETIAKQVENLSTLHLATINGEYIITTIDLSPQPLLTKTIEINQNTYWEIQNTETLNSNDLLRSIVCIKREGESLTIIRPNKIEKQTITEKITHAIKSLRTTSSIKNILLTQLDQNGIFSDEFSRFPKEANSNGGGLSGGKNSVITVIERKNEVIDIYYLLRFHALRDRNQFSEDMNPLLIQITDGDLMTYQIHYRIDPKNIKPSYPFSSVYSRGGFFLGENGRSGTLSAVRVDTLSGEIHVFDQRIGKYLPEMFEVTEKRESEFNL